jgi:hypothetical protein
MMELGENFAIALFCYRQSKCCEKLKNLTTIIVRHGTPTEVADM